jgi:hypothetical protein
MNEALHVYLRALERELVRAGHGPDVLAEIQAHLEDAIAALRASGLDEVAATRTALDRFGPVADVARAFASAEKAAPMLRKLAQSIALVNTATAMLIAGVKLLDPSSGPGIFAMLVCVLVVGHGALVLFQPARAPWRDVQLVGALLLVIAGTAAVLRTVQLGQITGDFEYWAMMFAMGYVAQGALSAWTLRSGTPRPLGVAGRA